MNKRRRYLAKRRRAAWQSERMLDARVARITARIECMVGAPSWDRAIAAAFRVPAGVLGATS